MDEVNPLQHKSTMDTITLKTKGLSPADASLCDVALNGDYSQRAMPPIQNDERQTGLRARAPSGMQPLR
jgi:hypothetical protein